MILTTLYVVLLYYNFSTIEVIGQPQLLRCQRKIELNNSLVIINFLWKQKIVYYHEIIGYSEKIKTVTAYSESKKCILQLKMDKQLVFTFADYKNYDALMNLIKKKISLIEINEKNLWKKIFVVLWGLTGILTYLLIKFF